MQVQNSKIFLKYLSKEKKMHSKMKGRFEKRRINRHKKACFLLNVVFKVHFYFSHIPDDTDEIPAQSLFTTSTFGFMTTLGLATECQSFLGGHFRRH